MPTAYYLIQYGALTCILVLQRCIRRYYICLSISCRNNFLPGRYLVSKKMNSRNINGLHVSCLVSWGWPAGCWPLSQSSFRGCLWPLVTGKDQRQSGFAQSQNCAKACPPCSLKAHFMWSNSLCQWNQTNSAFCHCECGGICFHFKDQQVDGLLYRFCTVSSSVHYVVVGVEINQVGRFLLD